MSLNEERYRETMRQGEALNAKENWLGALRRFRVALALKPEAPEVYAGLGEACFGLKKLDQALESYKLAARYSRGDLKYLERVADLQERLGQLQDAARTYMAAAELQLRDHQLEDAVYNWERAVRLDPGLLGAHRRLAMVHQRQDNVRGAVREYLAIARILQARGLPQQALRMCRAALRLDPGNEDVLMAMRLVTEGEWRVEGEQARDDGRRTMDDGRRTVDDRPSAVSSPPSAVHAPSAPQPPAPQPAVRESMETSSTVHRPSSAPSSQAAAVEDAPPLTTEETVREIAAAFESERRQWQATQAPQGPADALTLATRRAQDALAEEIFREEEGEADLYGLGPQGLSKLERDALIGQGIDFQSRGDVAHALVCYEKAVAGGLRLPAAYFTLGLLYTEQGRKRRARAAFVRAGKDEAYREAIRMVMKGDGG